MAVWMCEEGYKSAMCAMEIDEPIEVHIEDGICVQKQEIAIQSTSQLEQCSSITYRILFNKVFYIDPQPISISEILLYFLCHVRNSNNYLSEALIT